MPGPTSSTCGRGWKNSEGGGMKSVDFYFDVGSPAAYLAWTQVPRIAQEAGATLVRTPFLLGGVFQATGNKSPMEVPAKGRYMRVDLERFAHRYGVPYSHNPFFPINTLMRGRGAAGRAGRGGGGRGPGGGAGGRAGGGEAEN